MVEGDDEDLTAALERGMLTAPKYTRGRFHQVATTLPSHITTHSMLKLRLRTFERWYDCFSSSVLILSSEEPTEPARQWVAN
jgi:hypothetical protein